MNRELKRTGSCRSTRRTKTGGKMTRLLLGGALGLVMLVLWARPGSAQTFTPTGDMNVPRAHHTAVLLNNGMVLIVGGYPESGQEPLASAELYDPATGTFNLTGSMSTARAQAKAVRLNNGKVLIVGGTSATAAIASAELYDPATGIFTPIVSMNESRYGATISLLNSGKVLIAGGWTGLTEPPAGSSLDSAELYDPATGTFTLAESMTTPRYLHTAALLNDGKVLLAGGELVPNSQFLTSAELYDPGDGSFSAISGSMITARDYCATVLLKNGKVLIAGGWNPSGVLAEAEVFDHAFDAFFATGSMNINRYGHTGTLLKDGKVLIAGGFNGNYPRTAELYDPATGAFTFAGDLNVPRASHTATLLDNGQVLIAGGADGSGRFPSAELYAPGPTLVFEGFFNPIDNPPTLNSAKAGQAIPVKWRVTGMDGQPVSDPESFVSITSYEVSCETFSGESASAVDEYAAGSSGLQYLGDGWWQFNWRTPKTYAGHCRTMKLTLSDQKEYTANFSFK